MKKRTFKKELPLTPYCGKPIMAVVENGNIEKALKELKQQLKDAKVFLTLYKNAHYEKPSEKRRKARHLAILREKYRKK